MTKINLESRLTKERTVFDEIPRGRGLEYEGKKLITIIMIDPGYVKEIENNKKIKLTPKAKEFLNMILEKRMDNDHITRSKNRGIIRR